MRSRTGRDLTEGSVLTHLYKLTLPGIGGSLAITLFNITDTFFVSRLGTEALAAMGFTFPVVMIIGSLAMGISLGSGSVLSRAMGRGDHHMMERTATDGILLSLIFVALISFLGLLTLDPLFSAMGASGEVLTLTKEYMVIWYLGSLAVIMPPVSDSCLRATGDMMRPLVVMIVCALCNVILDPILIYGLFGFPAMGIRGAALATVISRFIGMIATLSFLHFHAGLLDLKRPALKEILESWKRILHVGLPSAFTQVLMPLTRGVITRLAAFTGGATAVAAVAAGSRIEGFANIIIMSYSMALVPMIGQNWGAGKKERIAAVSSTSRRFALIYGAVICLPAFFAAGPISSVFSADPLVVAMTARYLRVMLGVTFALSFTVWTSQSLNAAGKPGPAARLNIVGYLLLIIPLSALGTWFFGFSGLIGGMATGQIFSALYALFSDKKHFFH